VIKRLQPERDELKAETERLRAEVKALQERLDSIAVAGAPAATTPTAGCSLMPFWKSVSSAVRRWFKGDHNH